MQIAPSIRHTFFCLNPSLLSKPNIIIEFLKSYCCLCISWCLQLHHNAIDIMSYLLKPSASDSFADEETLVVFRRYFSITKLQVKRAQEVRVHIKNVFFNLLSFILLQFFAHKILDAVKKHFQGFTDEKQSKKTTFLPA